jgi:DNA polymerase (family 10)
MKYVSNVDIAKILHEMAAYYDMDDVLFKPRAYEKAALGIENLEKEAEEIYREGGLKALEDIPGVGKGIAGHLEDFFTKGHFREYERLKKKIPVDVAGLLAIEGVGPKTIKTFWKKLRVQNREDLGKAARAGKIRLLERFGKKSEEKILSGIEFLKSAGGRRVLGSVFPAIRDLEQMILSFPEVTRVVVAGSVRRRKETIGDIDILAVSSRPEKVGKRFRSLPFIAHVYGSGPTKTNVRLKNGLDADLRVVPERSFGAALNYFTGSKDHNIALRELAIARGWKLNEYGLFKGTKMIGGRTEEGIYKKLGLSYIEPELRENAGEIEAAKSGVLPDLVGYDDLRGDLQVQTNWTDGADSIETMARAAHKAGLEYIAVTDHTRSLAMTGGADEKKLRQQMREVNALNEKLRAGHIKFHVLTGAEVNIGKDGSLDINNETLRELDVVGAAVHSHFGLGRKEQTKRVIRAIENPHADIIFHLTGRIINRRSAIDIDIDEIIRAARHTGTILEINASPDRLDLKDEHVRKCVDAGVKMAIDSDAHAKEHFTFLEYGIATARRGWASKKDIINARPLAEMQKLLKH